jgi:putative salt-induced outer membrane protein
MSIGRIALTVFVTAWVGTTALAHDEPAVAQDTGPWSGNVALGFLNSSGNTDDSSTTFNFLVAYVTGAWTHALDGRAYGASTNNQTTAEAYQLGWKTTYDIDERNYVFGALDWNKDRFASYVEQTFETLGYGRRVLDNETYKLNVEIGAGFAQQELAEFCSTVIAGIPSPACTPPAELVVGQDEDSAVGILGGDFLWNVNDTVTFTQAADIFFASDNTYWETVTAVRAGLVGNVGLVASYTIKANTDAPLGKDKRDTYTAISLDYAF